MAGTSDNFGGGYPGDFSIPPGRTDKQPATDDSNISGGVAGPAIILRNGQPYLNTTLGNNLMGFSTFQSIEARQNNYYSEMLGSLIRPGESINISPHINQLQNSINNFAISSGAPLGANQFQYGAIRPNAFHFGQQNNNLMLGPNQFGSSIGSNLPPPPVRHQICLHSLSPGFNVGSSGIQINPSPDQSGRRRRRSNPRNQVRTSQNESSSRARATGSKNNNNRRKTRFRMVAVPVDKSSIDSPLSIYYSSKKKYPYFYDNLKWTEQDAALMDELLEKYASEPSESRDVLISERIEKKTLFDIRVRTKWLITCGKVDPRTFKKIVIEEQEPSASSAARLAKLKGPSGKLLRKNAKTMGQISANLRANKMDANIGLFHLTWDNMTTIVKDFDANPGIFSPFPVQIDEQLLKSVLPGTNLPERTVLGSSASHPITIPAETVEDHTTNSESLTGQFDGLALFLADKLDDPEFQMIMKNVEDSFNDPEFQMMMQNIEAASSSGMK